MTLLLIINKSTGENNEISPCFSVDEMRNLFVFGNKNIGTYELESTSKIIIFSIMTKSYLL